MPQTLQGPKALAFARPLLFVGQGDERIRVLLGLRARALVVAAEAQRRAQGWACCPCSRLQLDVRPAGVCLPDHERAEGGTGGFRALRHVCHKKGDMAAG